MKRGRYRVEEVEAVRANGGGPSALEACLNEIGMDEQLKQVVPFADGQGYTKRFLVIIEPIARS